MNSEGKNSEKTQDHQSKQQQQRDKEQQQKENYNNENASSNYNEKTAELTAEWSVHAQLTISRPNVDNTGTGRSDGDENRKPVKFVYRWSSDDVNATATGTTATTTTTTTTTTTATGEGTNEVIYEGQSTPTQRTRGGTFRSDDTKSDLSGGKYMKNDSFHSGTGKPASDSGFSSGFYNTRGLNNKGSIGGTRCRSTCSIVLSAVADFLPVCSEISEEADPFTYNTATSYTVTPEKAGDDLNASQNFGGMKILALRDAFSQTSDNETRNYTEYHPHLQHQTSNIINSGGGGMVENMRKFSEETDGKKRKFYDYRRNIAAETMQQQYTSLPVDQTEEGISKSPFHPISPLGQQQQQTRPFKSSSQSSILQQQNMSSGHSTTGQKNNDPSSRKQPRTVHIDVYCTGSDAEDDDDDDEENDDDDRDGDESSSPSSENRNDLESNSTPQTVLDIEQMLLRHHRAGKNEIPRRIKMQQQQSPQHQNFQSPQQQQPLQYLPSQTIISELGHAITKSSTADEISESKQILFKKHIGDQKSNKYNLRNRSNFRKDPSDDCLSSNYPNSSRSTMRDLTCSSISSVVQSNICEDIESSWKETDTADGTATSLGKSDSFEYDNSIDRLRIRRMERLWSKPEKEYHMENEEYKSNTSTSDSPTKQLLSHQRHHIQKFLHNIHSPHMTETQQYEQLTDYEPYYPENNQHIEYPSIIPEKDEPSPEFDAMIIPPTPAIPSQQQLTIPTQLPFTSTTITEKQSPSYGVVDGRYVDHSTTVVTLPIVRGRHPPSYGIASGKGDDTSTDITGTYFRHSSSEPRSPERPPNKAYFHLEYNKSGSEASTLQSNLSGYTSEYLAKARKFGTVVTALKKPGHHVGPAKNPECQCEYCRRWMAERLEGLGRGRAFSMSDASNIQNQGFWLRREKPFQ